MGLGFGISIENLRLEFGICFENMGSDIWIHLHLIRDEFVSNRQLSQLGSENLKYQLINLK